MSRLICALLCQKSDDMISHDDCPDHDLEQVGENNEIRRDGSLKCPQHMGIDGRIPVSGFATSTQLQRLERILKSCLQ